MNNTSRWELKKLMLLSLSSVLLLCAIIMCFFPQHHILYQAFNMKYIEGASTGFILADYDMSDQYGNKVTWEKLSSQPLYLTTGFTRCGHSCPVTMSLYQRMFDRVEGNATFALLTIDPDYDSEQVMNEYLSVFNPAFVGLIIKDKNQLGRAVDDLKQYISRNEGSIDIAHASNIYLLHPSVPGLIIYTKPSVNVMLKDLHTINMM
ncbi:SCO family protein [Agarilytica rhodophyticola]|uniref:SCO family protein n=1 Tax=Agarilytica rhodophyticola TaxID=1737490 RepID=UPI000B345F52|nr:SCO family protein [Agarilytica rhodophyticola]